MTNLSRLEDRADLQISIVLLASWAAITLSVNWGNWPPDLSAFYMAGHFWGTGQYDLIYAAPEKFFGPPVDSWTQEVARLGHPDEIFFPYIYPPIWAAVIAPLAKALSPTEFFNLFYLIHIAMIAGAIFLAYRLIRPPVPLALWCVISCGLAYFSLISSSALYHNQLQIMVTFLIILSLERYASGALITAGIALGIAAAIKVTPAALGIIFLLDRSYRPAIVTAITGLALLALSYLIAGPELHREFFANIGIISEQVAVMRVNWNLESFLLQMSALLTGTQLLSLEGIPPERLMDALDHPQVEPLWIAITTKLLLIAGTALVLLRTHALSPLNAMRLRPLGLILVMTLCAPLGWSHHYLPVLILLPAVLTFMAPVRAISLMIIFGGLSSLGVFALLRIEGSQIHYPALLNIILLLSVFALFFARPLHFNDKPPRKLLKAKRTG